MDPIRLGRTATAALVIAALANLVYAVTVPLGGSAEAVRDAAVGAPALATTAAAFDTVFRIGTSVGVLGLAQLARRRPAMALGGAWLVVVGSVCLTVVTPVTIVLAASGAAEPAQALELVGRVQGNAAFTGFQVAGYMALAVGVTLLLVALSADDRRLRPVIALFVLGSVLAVGLADVRLAQLAGALLTGTALVRLAVLLLTETFVQPRPTVSSGSAA